METRHYQLMTASHWNSLEFHRNTSMTEVYTIRWTLQGDTGENGSREQAGTNRKIQQAERLTQLIVTVQPNADGYPPARGQRPPNQQTTGEKQKAPPLNEAEDQDPQGDPTHRSAGQPDQPVTSSQKAPAAPHQHHVAARLPKVDAVAAATEAWATSSSNTKKRDVEDVQQPLWNCIVSWKGTSGLKTNAPEPHAQRDVVVGLRNEHGVPAM